MIDYSPEVEKAVAMLHGNWNQPTSRVSQYMSVLLANIDWADVPVVTEVCNDLIAASAKEDDDFRPPPFPLAGKVLAMVRHRRANPVDRPVCECEQGFVRLVVYRIYRGVGSLRADAVAKCARCNGGNFAPRSLWFDRLVLGNGGGWFVDWPEEGFTAWRQALFETCAKVFQEEQRLLGGREMSSEDRRRLLSVDLRWPQDREPMIESLIRRELWPRKLLVHAA